MRIGIFLFILALPPSLSADDARDRLIVETVLKLDAFNYESASAKVKQAIGRYLAKGAGSEEYYECMAMREHHEAVPWSRKALASLIAGSRLACRPPRKT